MKEAIRQKKITYKKMCVNRSEDSKASQKIYKKSNIDSHCSFYEERSSKDLPKLSPKPNNIFKLKKGKILKEEDA